MVQEAVMVLHVDVMYLVEVLQDGFIIGCPAERSSLEFDAIDILLLRLLQLNASM